MSCNAILKKSHSRQADSKSPFLTLNRTDSGTPEISEVEISDLEISTKNTIFFQSHKNVTNNSFSLLLPSKNVFKKQNVEFLKLRLHFLSIIQYCLSTPSFSETIRMPQIRYWRVHMQSGIWIAQSNRHLIEKRCEQTPPET